jgi:hypothetical protein
MTLTELINEHQSIVIGINQHREELQKRYDVAYHLLHFYSSLRTAMEEAGGNPDAFGDINSSTIGELAGALAANNIKFIHHSSKNRND